jgi:hypothetical protein
VAFADLRLAIVDEQHRFRRGRARAAGRQGPGGGRAGDDRHADPAHAEPGAIRRHGRQRAGREAAGAAPVKTALLVSRRGSGGGEPPARAMAEGRQAYWVCPLVEESEVYDAVAAEERFKPICAPSWARAVGLVHGQMPPAEKCRHHGAFQAGEHAGAGRDDGDRGGRRCAQRLDHGDRAGGPVRPVAAAPVARARRARRGGLDLPAAVPARRWDRRRSGG